MNVEQLNVELPILNRKTVAVALLVTSDVKRLRMNPPEAEKVVSKNGKGDNYQNL